MLQGASSDSFPLARNALRSAIAATDKELFECQQTREEWLVNSIQWKRHLYYDQLTKLQSIYHRLLRTAASRTLEMRTVKAHSFGQKHASRLMDGILKKHGAMAKDVKLFNEILKELPSEHAPHKLSLAAFKGTEDLTPGLKSEKARDALFHLHVLKSDLLGTLEGPKSYWARSGYVRVGIA